MTTGPDIEMLTVDEVAAYLKIHVSKARRMIRMGDLRIIHFSDCVRVARSDLEQFVTDHAVTRQGTK